MRKNLKFLFAVAAVLCGQSVSALDFTHLASTKPSGGESAPLLIDGNQETKWGEGHNNGSVSYIVFKASMAVKPASYTLTIANDTHNSKGRNWMTWRIYAANFDNDADATKDADAWVLIDSKQDITAAQFPVDEQYQKTKFNVSGTVGDYYEYFKIEVIDIVSSGNYMQMGEFEFTDYEEMNKFYFYTAKLNQAKQLDTTALPEDDPLVAEYNGLLDAFSPALTAARKASDYTAVEAMYAQILTVGEAIKAIADGAEFITLEGYTDWGDGQPEHLTDGNHSSKWGLNIPEGGASVVFRATNAVLPYYYTLITGNDTQSYKGRNWKNWKIYGANFESLADAKSDSEAWVLLDERENIGQDLLPAKNNYAAPFSFTEEIAEAYYYFKVEVTAAYSGGSVQMNEIILGTEEEFEAQKQAYLEELSEYVVPASATAEEKAAYKATIADVEKAIPESILAAYVAATDLQKSLFSYKQKNGVYQIECAADLDGLATVVNGGEEEVDAVLVNDIDAAGYNIATIGFGGKRFKGTFDGQGHTICNYKAVSEVSDQFALFGTIENATIKNVMMKGAYVVGDVNIAALVGQAINSTIECCAVVDSYLEGRDHTGSIAGDVRDNTIFRNNYSNAEVYSREYQAGGMIGTIIGGTIENNLFLGKVSCEYSNGTGLVSLVDGDANPNVFKNNAIFMSTIDAPDAHALTNTAGRGGICTFENNYTLDKCLYNGGYYGLTNPNDENGGQVDWIEATTKSFYAETLGWDMEGTWKFLYGGLYPILYYMEYDGPTDLAIDVNEEGYSTFAVPVDIDFSQLTNLYAYAVKDNGSYVKTIPVTQARHGEAVLLSKADFYAETPVKDDETTGEETDAPQAAEENGITIDGNVITIVNAGVQPGATVLVDMNQQGWKNREVVSEVKFLGGTVSFSKTGKSNDAAFYVVPEGVRMYANNVLTIASSYGEIAKVVITCDQYEGVDYVGNEGRTVEYDPQAITLTNTYDEEVGGVQLRVKTIEITYSGEGPQAVPFSSVEVEANPDNDLIGAFEDIEADGTQYMFCKVNDVLGFYCVEPQTFIPAGKGYLQDEAADEESGVKLFNFKQNTETGIATLPTEGAKQSSVIYDLTGRRVEKATKGIYIINGKKVLK